MVWCLQPAITRARKANASPQQAAVLKCVRYFPFMPSLLCEAVVRQADLYLRKFYSLRFR